MATCGLCGLVAEPAAVEEDAADAPVPLGWSVQTDERGRTLLCPRCTRDNVRSIEGRLDPQWW